MRPTRGLTPPTCLRRVGRLKGAGIITGYRVVIGPRGLGTAPKSSKS